MRPRPRVLGPVLALLLSPLALVPTAAPAADPASDDVTTIAPGDPLLDEAQRGRRAIRQLDDELAVAAARNDLRPSQLRSLLRTDETAWVDPEGLVYFVEPLPEQVSAAADAGSSAAVAPLADTFALHSNPGAARTILLDFDGAVVSGTGWNDQRGVSAGPHPAWDPGHNGDAFTDAELAGVQQVWAMVAEDFAPFDVDVTTQDPGDAGLVRSSTDDTVYGTRVLVTPSADAADKICGGDCGGVAYLSVFDRVGSYTQPAWVFPQALGNDPKSVAEAASHEAGHNLGLRHDGTSTQGYYEGHGVWAPIMGVGYHRPLAQWSRGSYAGADNQQDDLSILTGYLGPRPDEAADSVLTPATLPDGEAVISTPGDVDAYLLGTCTAGSTVSVLPAADAPNLDVRAVLRDASGAQRAVAAPAAAYADRSTARGLDATLTVPTDDVGWVLTVEGAGEGAWASNGYDDYGSLGAYSVSAPGCDTAVVTGVPGAPTGVSAGAAGPGTLSLTWSAPAPADGGPVTGYVVTRSGSAATQTLAPDARSHTFTGLAAQTAYQLSVRAVNAAGAGRAATVTATTAAPAPAVPSAPRDLRGAHDPERDQLEIWWTEPLDGGSQPITGYEVRLDGEVLSRLPEASLSVDITSEGGWPEGQYVVSVAAVNAVGTSPMATVTVTVDLPDPPPPPDPTPTSSPTPTPTPTSSPTPTPTASPTPTVGPTAAPPAPPRAGAPSWAQAPKVVVRNKKVVVRWAAASPNGSSVLRYGVDISKGKDLTKPGSARKAVFKRLKPGRYKIRLVAINALGASPRTSWVKVRVR